MPSAKEGSGAAARHDIPRDRCVASLSLGPVKHTLAQAAATIVSGSGSGSAQGFGTWERNLCQNRRNHVPGGEGLRSRTNTLSGWGITFPGKNSDLGINR